MPTTLAQLTATRKPLTITVEELELTVEYYPMRITSEMLVAYTTTGTVQELPDDQALAVITSPGATLLHVLAGWDLMEPLDEDGTPSTTPLEINEANITALGIFLQWALLHAIMQDAGNQGKAIAPADSAKKQPSGASSSRKASSARSRTGIR